MSTDNGSRNGETSPSSSFDDYYFAHIRDKKMIEMVGNSNSAASGMAGVAE
jgi:hypothetical protein